MISTSEILSHIRAYDETDGEVAVKLESTTYDPNNKVVGDYTMVVSASDKRGNKAEQTITIKVVDVDKPTISGENNYVLSYDTPTTLDKIKGALVLSDNYDPNSKLVYTTVKDDYTGKERVVGNHEIILNVRDTSGNVSDNFSINVTVEDRKAPVITGVETINVPSNQLLTIEEIMQKFSVEDGLDGNITVTADMITGYDNYKTRYNVVGTYNFSISVSDKAGNNQTKAFKVVVDDNEAPEIWFDDYFIILNSGEELTEELIKEYASKVLGIKTTDIKEVKGDILTNEAGEKEIEIVLTNDEVKKFKIVIEDIIEYRALKWYEYPYIWFTVLFNIETKYRTNSFWEFSKRCSFINKIVNV